MESIVQKYTLYDLFGLFMPGVILIGELLLNHQDIIKFINCAKINDALLGVFILIIAYITGSLISFINYIILLIFHNINKKFKYIFYKCPFFEKIVHFNGFFYIFDNESDELTIYEKKYEKKIKKKFNMNLDMKNLKKSYFYFYGNKDSIEANYIQKMKTRNAIFKNMYSYLQTKKEYERIHIYNSLRGMYYNLSLVIVFIYIDLSVFNDMINLNYIQLNIFLIIAILSFFRGRYMYNTMIQYIIKYFFFCK